MAVQLGREDQLNLRRDQNRQDGRAQPTTGAPSTSTSTLHNQRDRPRLWVRTLLFQSCKERESEAHGEQGQWTAPERCFPRIVTLYLTSHWASKLLPHGAAVAPPGQPDRALFRRRSSSQTLVNNSIECLDRETPCNHLPVNEECGRATDVELFSLKEVLTDAR